MSIEQQQGEDERRRQEEDKVNAYADHHIKRGTGTWRDWESNPAYDMPGYHDRGSVHAGLRDLQTGKKEKR